jgi:cytochrome P450
VFPVASGNPARLSASQSLLTAAISRRVRAPATFALSLSGWSLAATFAGPCVSPVAPGLPPWYLSRIGGTLRPVVASRICLDLSMPLTFDPNHPGFVEDPYPLYAALRAGNPVHWSPALKAWVVCRYADVQHVLRDGALSSDRVTPFFKSQPSAMQAKYAAVLKYLGGWLVFRDAPDHTRLRALVARAFTPKELARVRPNIVTITEHLLRGMQRHGTGTIDLVDEFANPLPAYVIMDMLGVPRAMLADMKVWSDDIRLFIGTAKSTPDKYDLISRGTAAMADAFRQLIKQHRANPQPDVLSTLIAANETPVDGGAAKLSDDELIATAILFLFAGHETTTGLIAMGTHHMLARPDVHRQFLASSGTSANAAAAVEEFLRFDAPTPAMVRIAVVDQVIGGHQIRSGDRVWALLGAANRDPAAFIDPDRLDIARTPNSHVTFGFGPHFCLGAPLARLEAQIALPMLHARYPQMRAGLPAPAWTDGLSLRGPVHVMVELGAHA